MIVKFLNNKTHRNMPTEKLADGRNRIWLDQSIENKIVSHEEPLPFENFRRANNCLRGWWGSGLFWGASDSSVRRWEKNQWPLAGHQHHHHYEFEQTETWICLGQRFEIGQSRCQASKRISSNNAPAILETVELCALLA